MENKPLISVIIPTYNRAIDVEKAIKSFISQKNNNFELIIIDDGSTDNTENLIKSYINSTQGTIDYGTGEITVNSLNIASITNIGGTASTIVQLTVTPNSNDIVPVRDQIVEIDVANSNVTVIADSFVGGSAEAGVGYTTTSSY